MPSLGEGLTGFGVITIEPSGIGQFLKQMTEREITSHRYIRPFSDDISPRQAAFELFP